MTEQTGPAVFAPDGSHTHTIPAPAPAPVPVPVPTPVPVPVYAFSDEFDGQALAAGYDEVGSHNGRGIWGTGEVENMINSVKTAYLDGQSHLVIACVSDGPAALTAPA